MKIPVAFLVLVLALAGSACISANQPDDVKLEILKAKGAIEIDTALMEDARAGMVQDQLIQRGIYDPRVLDAMASIRREDFIPEGYRPLAYYDGAVPIAEGRSTAQPYVIAFMVQALNLSEGEAVLEIGTGSGYQTALLAELAGRVYSIEPRPDLANQAEKTLSRLGYDNIKIRVGDGHRGWRDESPFDAIISFAALEEVPPALLDQLKSGGRFIAPLVDGEDSQTLTLIEKAGNQSRITRLAVVRFHPLESPDQK